jgi:8-oxo-dGTP pyrophosphatase MutT (NUDIX family)
MSGSEIIDVFTCEGKHDGQMRRSLAHASKRWHHTAHCWVVAERASGTSLLAQRRHSSKNRPGLLDAAAGGHLLSGEDSTAAVREIHEELGAEVSFDSLHFVGQFPISHGGKGCDNEFANLFVLRDDRPVRGWKFDPREASSLVEIPVEHLRAAVFGNHVVTAVEHTGSVVRTMRVTRKSFTPLSDEYWEGLLAVLCPTPTTR